MLCSRWSIFNFCMFHVHIIHFYLFSYYLVNPTLWFADFFFFIYYEEKIQEWRKNLTYWWRYNRDVNVVYWFRKIIHCTSHEPLFQHQQSYWLKNQTEEGTNKSKKKDLNTTFVAIYKLMVNRTFVTIYTISRDLTLVQGIHLLCS